MKRELLKIAKDLDKENINETEARSLLLGLLSVSDSLSDMEVKWLVLYGQKDRESKQIDKDGGIDYAFNSMFDLLETNTVFNAKEVKRIFWDRMKLLINYR